MIVYRVETQEGRDVYFSTRDDEWEQAIEAHRSGNHQHPCWRDDGMESTYNHSMIFGFASPEQMKAWFNGTERLYMATFGLLCSCYVTSRVSLGHNQLAFYREDATLLWQKPLSHF